MLENMIQIIHVMFFLAQQEEYPRGHIVLECGLNK